MTRKAGSSGPAALTVTTSTDGDVAIEIEAEPATGALPQADTPPLDECSTRSADAAALDEDPRGSFSIRWFFNNTSIPSETTAANSRDRAVSATQDLMSNRNRCGVPDQTAARYSYQGYTDTDPGISRSGNFCLAPDSQSVVGYVQMSDLDPLAGTCTYRNSRGEIVEVDVGINYYQPWWERGSCTNDGFHLEGVLVHEFGHGVGFGHAGPSRPNDTMAPSIGPCEDGGTTFSYPEATRLNAAY